MNKELKRNINNANMQVVKLIIILGAFFFASMTILQIKGVTLSIVFQILFIIIALVNGDNLRIDGMEWIVYIGASLLITTIFAYSNDHMKESYRGTAVYMLVLILPTIVFALLLNSIVDCKMVYAIRKSIIIMANIQSFCGIMQYIFFKVFNIDIIALLGREILGLENVNTALRDGTISVSGLSFHAAVLAPLIAILFFMNASIINRMLAIILAVLSGNSTALIVLFACICISSIYGLIGKDRHISRKTCLLVFCLVLLIISLAIKYDLFMLFRFRVDRLLNRVVGGNVDASTIAHKRYFTEIFNVIFRGSIMRFLFGYGEGCSGYPFSLWYYQYRSLWNWAVECDVINILLSRGVVGFIAYYGFLLSIVRKGFSIDKRYSFITLAIMAGGFTYNIQFEWVFLIMVLFYVCINNGINLFEKRT